MKDVLWDIAGIIGILVFAWVLVHTLSRFYVRGESQFDRVAREFSAACGSVNGKATWNGRNWECLTDTEKNEVSSFCTVTRLMGMIDEYAMRCGTAHVSIEPARQALNDELVRLFTPLSDGNIRWLWSEAHNDTTDRMPFQVFAKIIEKYHGIGGES